jgi:hypothetical protein
MKSVRLAALAAGSLLIATTVPALAQSDWPTKPAEYVEVSGIEVDDGHGLDYANHLAGQWRKGQDYAMQQGWITGYEILTNENPREGEPDIYLLTRFTNFADAAESERRDAMYLKHMAATTAQMQAASGDRAKYRKQKGSMLLRRQVWTK